MMLAKEKINKADKAWIASLAKDVQKEFGIEAPIDDMDSVVRQLGGSIQRDVRAAESVVMRDGDGFRIVLSPSLDEKKNRFAIACELGHLFLHMGYRTRRMLWEKQVDNVAYFTASEEKEKQAKEFALAFLMPSKKYTEALKGLKNGDSVDVEKVAEIFHVSIMDAYARGKGLGCLG